MKTTKEIIDEISYEYKLIEPPEYTDWNKKWYSEDEYNHWEKIVKLLEKRIKEKQSRIYFLENVLKETAFELAKVSYINRFKTLEENE